MKLLTNIASGLLCIILFTACNIFKHTESASIQANEEPTSQNSIYIKNQLLGIVLKALDIDEAMNSLSDASKIKINMPSQWGDIQQFASSLQLNGTFSLIENKIDTITQDLGKVAYPHLKNAIDEIALTDALNIINGNTNSLSAYLKNTSGQKIEFVLLQNLHSKLEVSGVNKMWSSIIPKFNIMSTELGEPNVNANLDQFVSTRAIDEIFSRIEKEEFDLKENSLWESRFTRN